MFAVMLVDIWNCCKAWCKDCISPLHTVAKCWYKQCWQISAGLTSKCFSTYHMLRLFIFQFWQLLYIFLHMLG